MNCREFEARIDDVLADRFDGSLQEHLVACADCAQLIEVLQGADAQSIDLVPFLRAHRLAEQRLPELAQLDPGVEFTQAVLRRTRALARLRRQRHAVTSWWLRQLERPQFAGEFAYAATVLLLLGVLVPASPFSSWPRELMGWLQSEQSERSAETFVQAGIVPLASAPARWIDSTERAGATVGEELDARLDLIGVVLEFSQPHAKGIGRALWERDWDALRPLLTQMRCDLRLLWDATRGTLPSGDEDDFRC